MAIDQTRKPATATSDNLSGDIDWTNPSNALTSDDSYALALLPSFLQTYYLKLTNFSFNIPEGATIVGIKVSFEAKGDIDQGMGIGNTQLVVGGSLSGDADSTGGNLSDVDAIYTRGSATSLWGLTPTRAQVNASDFGVVLSFFNTGFGGVTVTVDSVTITIYHTVLAAPLLKKRITVGNGMVTSEIAY